MIIHAQGDDGVTQTTGNAGARLAQCVIGAQTNAVADVSGLNFATAELAVSGATQGNIRRLKGRANFQQIDANTVQVSVRVCGFQPTTQHAFAITATGDLTFAAGQPNNLGANAVVLTGTLTADVNGLAESTATYNTISLNGTNSIIGRGFVVYETTDASQAVNRSLVGVVGSINASPAAITCGLEWVSCVFKATALQASPVITGSVMIKHLPNDPNGVTITGQISGFAPNTVHGWHIHELGHIGSSDGSLVGGHYNPFSTLHGLPNNTRHIGDMGNLVADNNGNVVINGYFPTPLVAGFGGIPSVIGRAIILHNLTDDGSDPVGASGTRLAQCVIGIANDNNTVANFANQAVHDNNGKAVGSYYGVCEMASFNPASFNISGRVIFTESTPGVMRVQAAICGVAPNTDHGFHVHSFGDLQTGGLPASLGGHYNPVGVAHGYYEDTIHHVGDMGNVTADANGLVLFDKTFNGIQTYRMLSIIGRSVAFHTGADQGAGQQPSGASGAIIATCVVGVTYPTAALPNPPSLAGVCGQTAAPTTVAPTPTPAPPGTTAVPGTTATPTTTKSFAPATVAINVVLMVVVLLVQYML